MYDINILILNSFYLPGYKGGGPIKTIKNLTDYTSNSLSYKIITSDRDLGDTSPYPHIDFNIWNNFDNLQVFYVRPGIKGIIQIFKLIKQTRHDIIYLNSFFSIRFSIIPLLISRFTGQQIVLGPRGEFSKGALSLKSSKKRVFIKIFKLLQLDKNIVLQASSKNEAIDIKEALGKNVDIFIAEDIGSQEFTNLLPVRKAIITGVFVSRISPMKNLDVALKVLYKTKESVNYHIYGPIEDEDYWNECKKLINNLPSHIRVEYKGELNPTAVVAKLSEYDFFFMPTKGENYGHIIAEALCAGLPLVISDTTPWKNLESLGIGWDLPLCNLDDFSKSIEYLARMSIDEHKKMREAVLNWAKHKFVQQDAIEANIAMFHYAYNKKKGVNNAV